MLSTDAELRLACLHVAIDICTRWDSSVQPLTLAETIRAWVEGEEDEVNDE